MRIQSATESVRKHGIEDGMSLATARVLSPILNVEILDSDAENDDLMQLAEQLLRISPSVETLPPNTLVAEIGRVRLPHENSNDITGRERALLERARIRLQQLGHQASIVIADDPKTAHAIARWEQTTKIIAPGESHKSLSILPIESLSLTHDETRFLHSLGVRRVSEFAQLPASSIASRMGKSGLSAHTLARGRSQAQPISNETNDDVLSLSQEFPDPVIRLDALLFVLNALTIDICAHLISRSMAASKLSLHFDMENGRQTIGIRLGMPTRSPDRILRQLRYRLSRISLAAPIMVVTLEIDESTSFDGQQTDLINRDRRSETIADVTARLQDSLGKQRVSTPVIQHRHRPEARWTAHPIHAMAMQKSKPSPGAQIQARCLSMDPVHHWQGNPKRTQPHRPPLMLAPPLKIDVRTPSEGIPLAVCVNDSWIEIVACSGPEQIETEWWAQNLNRVYWRVQLSDGRHAWIYKEDGQWALHGWWDR